MSLPTKFALMAGLVGLAQFAHAAPIVLPNGPLFIQFQNFEQVKPDAAPGTENAWGIVQVRQISTGIVITPHDEIAGGSQIFNGTNPGGPQVTGIFYGLNATGAACPPGFAICSTGGHLDLYWDEAGQPGGGTIVNFDSAVLTPGLRVGNTYPGITDGIFLARLDFASGQFTDPTITLAGTALPTAGTNFTGNAVGYLNSNTAAGGPWAKPLNGDWFNTVAPGLGTRDLKFKNSYFSLDAWDSPGFQGAFSTDPVQAFVVSVPEPGSLALLATVFVGMGVFTRRRQQKI